MVRLHPAFFDVYMAVLCTAAKTLCHKAACVPLVSEMCIARTLARCLSQHMPVCHPTDPESPRIAAVHQDGFSGPVDMSMVQLLCSVQQGGQGSANGIFMQVCMCLQTCQSETWSALCHHSKQSIALKSNNASARYTDLHS